ncbi:hypothetical protein HGA64_02995, partial [Candidatus Falkowbacteria bacterium]|nr:hypothetical protein [Candidatus Falkowbacteria bacterium]
MQTLRKAIALSVIFVTVLSMSVAVAPQANAAASAGDLIKMNGLSSIYYLGGDGKRYVFPNEQTYFSWYSDFSSVMTIPQAELESYPLGANVTIRPGTKLVKITTNPKVYAVEPGGSLVAIPDEATAKTLYGDNWAKRVVDVADAFFTNYKIATKTVSATAYPTGSLIKTASTPDIYYVNADGSASKVASESAFNANRLKFSDVITTTVALPTLGADITSASSAITDTASGAGGTVYTGGTGLTIALSSATAQSGTLIAGQSLADIASFNLTASNDGAVKLTSLKLRRLGIAGDATLTNVYLYDGNNRLTDGSSVSSGVVTFSDGAGIVSVPAGTTKTISVKVDVNTVANVSGISGNTVGFGIAAATDVVAGAATVSGSFPANGNISSIAVGDSATLGTVTLTGVPTGAGASVNAATNQVALWSAPISVGVKFANLKYLAVKQIGSASYDAIQNFKLFVDGTQVGNAVALAETDGTVKFDVSS